MIRAERRPAPDRDASVTAGLKERCEVHHVS